jgi:tRNA-modifying protein YgfZ
MDEMAATSLPEIDAQYRALREGAGMLDRSSRGKLIVRGSDAAEYLQGQITNDVEALEPGAGCYAALLERKGHIQGDMRVLLLHEDEFWLDTEPESAAAVLRHLQMYSVGREVEIEDVSDKWEITSLIGPQAAELSGVEGLTVEHSQGFRNWEGVEVLGVATDTGCDLITHAGGAERLRELLAEAGAAEVSEAAAEIVRVETGRPRFGAEISPEVMPAEAGIVERAVDFEKGCYIGQEPVARLHYRGKPNRRLCGLRLSAPAQSGEPLRLDEREVGSLATVCVSPALGPIALALVRREAELGAVLEVGDGVTTAELVGLPFGTGE